MTSWRTANEPDGALPPSWYAETAPPYAPAPPLSRDLRAKTCVVGGGFTGLSAALHLAEAGEEVVLLEAAQAGWGASGRNGGQIGSGFNWSLDRLSKAIGPEEALAAYTLSEDAKALTRRLIAAHAPEADYRPGILHVHRALNAAQHDRDIARQTAAALGVSQPEWLDGVALHNLIGSEAFSGGVLDPTAGYCQPLAFARGLARAARTAGAAFYESTAVLRLAPGPPHRLETAVGTVTADRVVLACNGYLDGLSPKIADHVLPINNYIAVTEPLGAHAPMRAAHAVVDDRFVVNYWWQSRDGRLVYGGGESYGRRFPSDIAIRVRRNLARIYPDLADARFTHAWGGTLAVTATRLPYAAALAPNLLSVSGYSGHGLALSSLAGRAMAHALTGDAGEFDRLSRLPSQHLPGGRHLGPALTGAGLLWLSIRDRMGL